MIQALQLFKSTQMYIPISYRLCLTDALMEVQCKKFTNTEKIPCGLRETGGLLLFLQSFTFNYITATAKQSLSAVTFLKPNSICVGLIKWCFH